MVLTRSQRRRFREEERCDPLFPCKAAVRCAGFCVATTGLMVLAAWYEAAWWIEDHQYPRLF